MKDSDIKKYVLGIDTSNYTTSVAITDRDENILFDERKLLKVKKGERGLRQQEALFQHVDNLPELMDTVLTDETRGRIAAVAVSSRPRNIEGSYMPCFKAGITMGRGVAGALGIPYIEFSHQEGHIASVDPMVSEDFLCFHLSGGTGELLKVHNNAHGYDTSIIGRTLDISPGQLIDRIGVAMGLNFPAGAEMDKLALEARRNNPAHKIGPEEKIKLKDLDFNLSGIETKITRSLENRMKRNRDSGKIEDNIPKDNILEDNISIEENGMIAVRIFNLLSAMLTELSQKARRQTGLETIVFTGGVSKSEYISRSIKEKLDNVYFGENPADNATGTAILGGRYIWQQNR